MAKPLYMTTADAAADLNCSQDWITKLIRAGRIRATMFGSCWAVLATDLDKVRDLPLGRPPKKEVSRA